MGGIGNLYNIMIKDNKKKEYKSVFDTCVKIKKKQLKWIKKNKDTKTYAGFLDKIINHYKKQKYDETL